MEQDKFDLRKELKDAMDRHRVSQTLLGNSFPRPVSPQTISNLIAPKSENPSPLTESNVKDLLDAFITALNPTKFLKGAKRHGDPESVHQAALSDDNPRIFDLMKLRCSMINHRVAFNRGEMDNVIERDMESAQHSITFIGSISSTKLNLGWYRSLANHLLNNNELKISLFIETPQNLFWRSASLDEKKESDARPFETLVQKHEKLVRELKDQVENHLSQKGCQNAGQVLNRLYLFDCDFPIYTNIIQVDDTLYVTPRTHLRATGAHTITFDAKYPNAGYEQYRDYIKYIWRLAGDNNNKASKFVGRPEEEEAKVPVYSNNGITYRGLVRRSTLEQDPTLQQRVVHGIVFDRKGRMLLRYRDERLDRDNINLYDKSCGSIIRSADHSPAHALRRCVNREVFNQIISTINYTAGRIVTEPRELVNLGDWRGPKGLSECLEDSSPWYTFELNRRDGALWSFPGPRKEEVNLIRNHPHMYANIFIVICDRDFATQTNEFDKNYVDQSIFKWIPVSMELGSDVLPSATTNDLGTYFYSNGKEDDLFSQLCNISLGIRTVLGDSGDD